MENVKPWWQSVGVIGSTVGIVSAIGGLVGLSVTPDDIAEAGALWTRGLHVATETAGLVGAVMALWGRLRATSRIG